MRTHNLPMTTIISSGLMKGLYGYCIESKEAFVYFTSNQEFAPLRKYSEEICFDIALSYASEAREGVVLPLQAELEASGVSVYLLDVALAPNEPLWGIRFREGLFHSQFFVPILTEHYLARGGSAVELFDIARATVEHRGDEFFYPMIPVVRDASELPHQVFSARGAEAGRFDPQSFEWVRTHVFSVELSQGIPWLARFFTSLSLNAKGIRDSGFLECLKTHIDWIELCGGPNQRYAKFLIRNPALTYHHFLMYGNGGVKYYGMGEPSPAARRRSDIPDPSKAIQDWLSMKDPAPEPSSEEPRSGSAVKSWFCPNCHYKGAPTWKKPDHPERLRELGIVLRYKEGLAMCGNCGRTTMTER